MDKIHLMVDVSTKELLVEAADRSGVSLNALIRKELESMAGEEYAKQQAESNNAQCIY